MDWRIRYLQLDITVLMVATSLPVRAGDDNQFRISVHMNDGEDVTLSRLTVVSYDELDNAIITCDNVERAGQLQEYSIKITRKSPSILLSSYCSILRVSIN